MMIVRRRALWLSLHDFVAIADPPPHDPPPLMCYDILAGTTFTLDAEDVASLQAQLHALLAARENDPGAISGSESLRNPLRIVPPAEPPA